MAAGGGGGRLRTETAFSLTPFVRVFVILRRPREPSRSSSNRRRFAAAVERRPWRVQPLLRMEAGTRQTFSADAADVPGRTRSSSRWLWRLMGGLSLFCADSLLTPGPLAARFWPGYSYSGCSGWHFSGSFTTAAIWRGRRFYTFMHCLFSVFWIYAVLPTGWRCEACGRGSATWPSAWRESSG
jgi:hypothetical protein